LNKFRAILSSWPHPKHNKVHNLVASVPNANDSALRPTAKIVCKETGSRVPQMTRMMMIMMVIKLTFFGPNSKYKTMNRQYTRFRRYYCYLNVM
jgi:transposase